MADNQLTPDELARLDALAAQGRLSPEAKAALEEVRGGVTTSPQAPPASPGGFRQGWADVAQTLAAPIRSAVGGITGQVLHSLTPETVRQGPRSFFTPPPEGSVGAKTGEFLGGLAGNLVFPDTPEGAALNALLVLPGIGQLGMMPRAIQATSRVAGAPTQTLTRQALTLPAVGGLTAGVTGGDWRLGTAQGAIAPAAGALINIGQGAGNAVREAITRVRNKFSSDTFAEQVALGIERDIPAFRPLVRGVTGLGGTSADRAQRVLEALGSKRDIGDRLLSRMFDHTERTIERELARNGVTHLNLPALAGALQQFTPVAPPPGGLMTWFTIQDAFVALKRVAATNRMMGQSYARGNSSLTPDAVHAASVADKAADAEFRQALVGTGRDDLATAFAQASAEFRDGTALIDFMRRLNAPGAIKTAAPGETTGPLINPNEFRYLAHSSEGLPQDRFRGVWNAMGRGVDVDKTISMMRLVAPVGGKSGVSMPAPAATFRNPEGQPLSLPQLPRRLGGALAADILRKQFEP